MSESPVTNSIVFIKRYGNHPAIRQIGSLVAIAASVAVGVMLYASFKEPVYRPLDYQVNADNMASIADTLEKAGIKYKINDQDGLVYVDAAEVQAAKLRLSAAGVSRSDALNFSYLNNESALGNSQFLENTRYILALEEDLSKSIRSIQGISAAKVHIAVPQNNVFADENHKPTASILINTAPGFGNDKEKVRSIMHLVASSVPGLDPNDVTISDQYGHYLSSGLDDDSIFNADQLNFQNKVQSYYEKRIGSMIVPMVGGEDLNVRVFANIDFSQNEEAQEQYDPQQQVVRSEETRSEQNGSSNASGPAGALANTPPSGGTDGKSSNSSQTSQTTENIKNYELGKTVKYKKSNVAKIQSLSVAVVVGDEKILDPTTKKVTTQPVSAEKLKKIEQLVKATIGYNETRGDQVTIVNSSFNPIEAIPEVKSYFFQEAWFWEVVQKVIGILLGLFALYFFYRKLAKSTKVATANNTALVANSPNQAYQIKQEQLLRLREMAKTDANRVSTIIKEWVEK